MLFPSITTTTTATTKSSTQKPPIILMSPFNPSANPFMAMNSFLGNHFSNAISGNPTISAPSTTTSAINQPPTTSTGIFPSPEWLRNYQQQFAACLQSLPSTQNQHSTSQSPPTKEERTKTPKKFDFSSIASIQEEVSLTSQEAYHDNDDIVHSPSSSNNSIPPSPSSSVDNNNSLLKSSSPILSSQSSSVITSVGMNPFPLGFMQNPLMAGPTPFRTMPPMNFIPRTAWFMQPGGPRRGPPSTNRSGRTKKEYVCEYCKRRFTKSYNLMIHLRTHTNERPFSCPVCKKAFRRQDHLRDHQFTHAKEKPYICDICRKGFCQSRTMESHRQSAHGATAKPKRISPKGTPALSIPPMFPTMNPFFGNPRAQLNVNMFLASLQSSAAAATMSISQQQQLSSSSNTNSIPSRIEEEPNDTINQSTSSAGLQDTTSDHTTTTDSSILSSIISRETSTSPIIDP